VSWEIDFSEQAEDWLDTLDDDSFSRIAPAIDKLEEVGPTLGRPTVDRVKRSRHHNMKELRSTGGHIRICSRSPPTARRSCWSAATRPADGRTGTTRTFLGLTPCTTSIWRRNHEHH
jgi:hypothetical protein